MAFEIVALVSKAGTLAYHNACFITIEKKVKNGRGENSVRYRCSFDIYER